VKAALALVAIVARRYTPKPSAPVDVKLEARPERGGYQVTIAATPSADVADLTLRLDGREQRLGPTRASVTRTFSVHVPVAAGAGIDVVGSAAVGVRGGLRKRAGVLRVGAPAAVAAPKPETIRTLPDGRRVSEVR
jgi:hypothetical protein